MNKKFVIRSMISGFLLTAFACRLEAQTWIGAGGDNLWSTPENWDSQVPISSNTTDLIFDGASRLYPDNDISSPFVLRNITFGPSAEKFTISGNSLLIYGDVINNSASLQTIDNSITLGADSTWHSVSGDIVVSSEIEGENCNLTKTGSKILKLNNNASVSTFSVDAGTLIVDDGTLISKNTGDFAVFGGEHSSLVITNGATLGIQGEAESSLLYGSDECSIFVSGVDTKWTNNSSNIEFDAAKGDLMVNDGAVLEGIYCLYLGYENNNNQNMIVITNGATMSFASIGSNKDNYIGYNSDSNSLMVVGSDDDWSVLNMSGNAIRVGQGNSRYNKLVVSEGGVIQDASNIIIGGVSGGNYNDLIIKDGAQVDVSVRCRAGGEGSGNTITIEGTDPSTGIHSFLSVSELSAGTSTGNDNNIIINEAVVSGLNKVLLASTWKDKSKGNFLNITNNAKVYFGSNSQIVIANGGESYDNIINVSGSQIYSESGTLIKIGFDGTSNTLHVTDNSFWDINEGRYWQIGAGKTYGAEFNGFIIDNGSVITNGTLDELKIGCHSGSDNNFLVVTNNARLYLQVEDLSLGCVTTSGGGNYNRLVLGGGSLQVIGNAYLGTGSANNLLTVYEDSICNFGDESTDSLFIGYNNGSDNAVNINTGAQVSAYNIVIDSNAGGNKISLNGGTLNVNNLMVSNDNYINLNQGLLVSVSADIDNNRAFEVGDGVSQAEYRVDGGTNSIADGMTVTASGILSGKGTLSADIIVDGTIAPGNNSSAGILSLTGDVTLNEDAVLYFDIGGTEQGTAYDKLSFDNPLNLNKATLKISLDDDFTPVETDVFTIMTAPDISGIFDNLMLGSYATVEGSEGSFLVTVNSDSIVLSQWNPKPRSAGSVIYIQ